MKNIAFVDTSWLMYKNFHALSMLSVTRETPLGQTTVPTGHVYGFWQDINNLSKHYAAVILCVDSIRHERKQYLPAYKEGRHEDGGYNIYNDLVNILTLCTSLPNVFYVKEPEYETDDLMASFIRESLVRKDRRYTFYHCDNDILQTPGEYDWCPKIGAGPQDRLSYISGKYLSEKVKIEYDYLPIWVKVIKGDSSDKISPAIPRFPTDKLKLLVDTIPESQDFDLFISTIKNLDLNSAWKERLKDIDNKESALYKQLYANYKVVCPAYIDVNKLKYKKLPSDLSKVQELLDWYAIKG